MPNEEAKLLIGRWAIVSKKGSVVTSNPYAVATDLSDFNDIIFKKNGRFKEREWSVINYGEKYEISVRVSATGEEENVIKYSKRGSQLFKVTSDSLFLIDEAGPWTWKYSRK